MFFNKIYSIGAFVFLFSILLILKNGFENLNIFTLCASIGLLIMPFFIKFLKKINPNGQPIRDLGPESHLESKKMTPTAGGIFIILGIMLSSLFFCDFQILMPTYLCLILFLGLGFYDDYLKILKSNSRGISEMTKFIGQFLFSSIIVVLIYLKFPDVTKIYIPFFKQIFDIGIWFIPFGIFIIIASSNALNLTDGLDGLAISQFIIIIGFFILTLLGFSESSKFLTNAILNSEMLKFLTITLSFSIVFLWFNTFPAKIFMGDAGSLSLGALIGALSLIFLMPLMLSIFGAIIVFEVLSVIIQVSYFKYTKKKTGEGKRIFLMSPIHHHFEKKNIHENSIVIRMMIISVIMAIISMQI